ncbi:transcription factor bHLH18-like [Tripterygium wilfordii]|uniref:Transcription factor bHLH18-like n=1 Tax=Tripterygium wilfordii TaxID=458696 RepID=A0A7J7CDC3_TRIWF|nr:transcription factor bHLH18-like [Tripterygium wilfordii]XP_038683359.1 transcription factor bHLH18-like [Tripterygium wilfordii]XP_038683360.1 transcription factor bHLH18-like [Tripterygium wilfordii]KAF5731887.1 transcription factor bHLH18-like [Tripterygium wilfordii]
MEISAVRVLPELGLEDPSFFNQWHMNSVDEFSILPLAAAFGDNLHHSFSHQTFDIKTVMEASHGDTERPVKLLKPNGWNSCKTGIVHNPQTASSPNVFSFVNPNHTEKPRIVKPKEETVGTKSINKERMVMSHGSFGNQSQAHKASQGTKRIDTSVRLSPAQDHIIAERKRREKLSQRFIALSAIVPGLKKMDKASVLGDAIKYLKQLQERVKILEEQTRKKTMESVVYVKRSQIFDEDENSSSGANLPSGPLDEPLLEIEARFCDKNVLIRIHCEKIKGILEKTVAEIEKLCLTVVNSSVMSFGTSALDITIISQMDAEFSMSVKDLVKSLRTAFELFRQ